MMNNNDILILTFELKDKIINSDEYIDLKSKEKMMLEDSGCSFLLSEFEKIKEEYKSA